MFRNKIFVFTNFVVKTYFCFHKNLNYKNIREIKCIIDIIENISFII